MQKPPFYKFKWVASITGIVISSLVIIGWLMNIPTLQHFLPGLPTMKFNTALVLFLNGWGIFFSLISNENLFKNLRKGIAAFNLLIGVLTLAEYIWGIDMMIDQWVVKDLSLPERYNATPGRMAFMSALSITLLALAILLQMSKHLKIRILAQFQLHLVSLICFVAIVGYAMKEPVFYSFSELSSMALHTSIVTLLYSISIAMNEPKLGLVGLLSGNGLGNLNARIALPTIFIAICILASIRMLTHQFGWVSVDFGIALFALSFLITATAIVWIASIKLNELENVEKQAKNKLKEVNLIFEQNKIFVTQSPNAIAMFDKNMRYIAASKKWLIDYQIKDKNITGKSHYEIFPEIGDDWKNIHKDCLKGSINTNPEAPFVRADGSVQWISWDVRPWYNAQNEIGGLLMFTADVTENKNDKEKLEKINRELKAILDVEHVSIIGTDIHGVISHFNKGAEQMLGYEAHEMIGKKTPVIIHDEEEILKHAKLLSEEYQFEVKGFDTFVTRAKKGEYESKRWTYIKKNGEKIQVQLVVTALRNSKNEIIGFLGTAVDITAQIKALQDLERAKNELENLTINLKNKNTQLSDFAHIISHNLRAPVSNLNALVDIYNKTTDSKNKEELIRNFKEVSFILKDTLDDLMNTLQIKENKELLIENIKLDLLLEKIQNMLHVSILENQVSIELQLNGFTEIMSHRVYLESILLNLISNAIKYRKPNVPPKIIIETYNQENKMCIAVKDNGLGINLSRYGDKIFGFNKTFHRHPEAKGVGLYMTKSQVEALGGSINVESEVEVGSKFIITFDETTPQYE